MQIKNLAVELHKCHTLGRSGSAGVSGASYYGSLDVRGSHSIACSLSGSTVPTTDAENETRDSNIFKMHDAHVCCLRESSDER